MYLSEGVGYCDSPGGDFAVSWSGPSIGGQLQEALLPLTYAAKPRFPE